VHFYAKYVQFLKLKQAQTVFITFKKIHLQRPPSHPFEWKIHHFSGEGTGKKTKNKAQNSSKQAI